MALLAFGLIAALFLVNVVLWALVLNQRQDIVRMGVARGELWDAYAALLAENTRSHQTLTAARDAHEELQRAFLHLARWERVA